MKLWGWWIISHDSLFVLAGFFVNFLQFFCVYCRARLGNFYSKSQIFTSPVIACHFINRWASMILQKHLPTLHFPCPWSYSLPAFSNSIIESVWLSESLWVRGIDFLHILTTKTLLIEPYVIFSNVSCPYHLCIVKSIVHAISELI